MENWIEVGLQYLGFPSKLYASPDEGNTPYGFDCSGFVQYVLLEAKISLPCSPGTDRPIRHTDEFFDHFGVLVHDKAARQGDIVFFSRNGKRPTHIGFYLGEGRMLHSPGVDGACVSIRSIEGLCRPLRYLESQIYLYNPVGYKRPAIRLPGKRYHKILHLDEIDRADKHGF